MRTKNRFRLNRRSARRGYDWWWHSFVGTHAESGARKPFFIEYYVINPGLWDGEIVWGQHPQSMEKGVPPCYAMIKAGTWGEAHAQLHNFYGISDFNASDRELDCRMGDNRVTEELLSGRVEVSERERDTYPERMSDAGSMSWDLRVSKELAFDVGYGTSALSSFLNLFHMYWHAEGMRSHYQGEVLYNGQRYLVHPDSSFGYQDKNWGRDYTNPWIWLNCNNFYSETRGKQADVSLVVGGGCPVLLGYPLNRRILTALWYEGRFLEFNFTKFWTRSRQQFFSREDKSHVYWEISAENRVHLVEIRMKCEKSKMLLINYENAKGARLHKRLWNGGNGAGTVKLFRKRGNRREAIDLLRGELAGCEYGAY